MNIAHRVVALEQLALTANAKQHKMTVPEVLRTIQLPKPAGGKVTLEDTVIQIMDGRRFNLLSIARNSGGSNRLILAGVIRRQNTGKSTIRIMAESRYLEMVIVCHLDLLKTGRRSA